MQTTLPVQKIAAEVNNLIRENGRIVVTAPPGAGKSTFLPLSILDIIPQGNKILMLEPRRIAARQLACRMADMLGENVGQTVGYRIRFENKVSSSTRIEVITEGILSRMLVTDPTMEGVAAVIFDEFHERSLNSDSALALTMESQQILRDDLRIIIMSATIDSESICKAIGASHIHCEGRMFPVQIVHPQVEANETNCAEVTARIIREAHSAHEGDILAFLPGEAEIRSCAELLGSSLGATRIFPLYGMLPQSEQQEAIAPSPSGMRKVVLATPIAETSLTIEGVRIVVDSGLFRKMQFNSQNSLSSLVTERISKDMADQRSGRAGRVAPGVCYRLWSLATEQRMSENRIPEILEADLCSCVLDAAAWGCNNFEALPWLTPPPKTSVAQAYSLLQMLGAVDSKSGITPHGKKLASFPCHPRIAQMLIKADSDSRKALACDIAAILEEKDPMASEREDASICTRVNALRRQTAGRNWKRIGKIAAQYRSISHVGEDLNTADEFAAGALIAAAYPERIAKVLEDGNGRYRLACSENAYLSNRDALSSYNWIAIASMNRTPGVAGRVFLAAPLDPGDIDCTSEVDNISWDSRRGEIIARHEKRAGCLVVEERELRGSSSADVRKLISSAICDACRKDGRSILNFSDDVENLQRRVAAVAQWHPELNLPDLTADAVLERCSEWLPMFLGNATNLTATKKIDLCEALWSMLSYEQQSIVDRLAPTHIKVPTGSSIRLEYRQGADAPVLRVRLQECFGMTETPCINDGRVPILMELLSPGFKPVQLTSDLHSFWNNTYFEVRKELRRRYPKHSWPENPLEAEATRRVTRK